MNIRLIITSFALLLFSSSGYATFQTTNPHGALSHECTACHSVEGWKTLRPDMQFKHEQTGYSLEGAHDRVSCKDCHVSLVFSQTQTSCENCHVDIHENQFGVDCERCHSPQRWIDESRMAQLHYETRFPLTGVHASLDCQVCHRGGEYVNLPVNCEGCHFEDYLETSDPAHAAAGFSMDCASCHRDDRTGWGYSDFEHTPAFPLTGGHRLNNCEICHESSYTSTSSECYSCHESDYRTSSNPDHSGSSFPLICEDCHTIVAWRPAQFDHDISSFQLLGTHSTTDCAKCHRGGQYTGTPDQCYGCHDDDYEEVGDPDHVSGNYDQECTTCHDAMIIAWIPATIDHNIDTNYPLTGSHIEVECNECHSAGYNDTPSECFPCHEEDYNEVEDPNHVNGNYDQECTICHDNLSVAWSPAIFDHSGTAFSIDGAHLSLDCIDCHETGFNDTPVECYGCHREDFEGTADPNHVSEQFDHNCLICHTTTAWEPSTFNHDETGFPLDGAHTNLNCITCHINGYVSTPSQCYDCHRENFDNASDPVHTDGSFDHECRTCHTTAAWSPSSFNHNNDTEFELTGSHITVNCAECHIDGVYDGTPEECFDCHEEDYNNTDDPDHQAENYPHECGVCHSTIAWEPAAIDHDQTDFPLTGRHREVECSECHVQSYSGTPTDCWSCHQAAYESTDDPDHAGSGFPHDCEICHTTAGWTPAEFDHSQTDFPLTGAHIELDCNDCHSQGYTGTPVECYACHQDDYEGADDPDHSEGQFDHNCTVCHTTDAWEPATFDHDQTDFPLTGSHRDVDCAECHINGQFADTPTECFFCHEDDYNDTDDPDHQAAGFPTDCEQCHNTTDWEDADFNHLQWFPIYTGRHRNEWESCSDCHTNPNDFTVFSCIDCHEHNRQDTDRQHDEEEDYVYESEACYECHPDGTADDGPNLQNIDDVNDHKKKIY
ncbi:hypothetical protein ACFLQJ_01450 [Calditrichota bacterium]